MARLLLAIIAAVAFGILLVMPDEASARAGAARGARSVGGIHRGGAAIIVRKPAMHHRGVAWRRGLAIRHRAVLGWPAFGFGAGIDDAVAAPVGYGGSGCRWERVQIDDDYGWRVRDVMVCPPGPGGPVGQPNALPK